MKEGDEIETNDMKTFFEKRNCYSGYSISKLSMLLFLKIVTKGRKVQKSRLNNSLKNGAFQFSNVTGLIETFEEFILVEMKVKKQKLSKYSLSFFAWKCAYTL